ncbi:MAG: protein kinase [Deltaproteobacteria bacterium]|nr:protein kinase [Deltaproteobacteria bacterium]
MSKRGPSTDGKSGWQSGDTEFDPVDPSALRAAVAKKPPASDLWTGRPPEIELPGDGLMEPPPISLPPDALKPIEEDPPAPTNNVAQELRPQPEPARGASPEPFRRMGSSPEPSRRGEREPQRGAIRDEAPMRGMREQLDVVHDATRGATRQQHDHEPRPRGGSSARYKPIQERRNAATEHRAGDLDPAMLGPKYRVEKVLGEGGMGTVYEARHLGLDRRVAVKVLSKKMAEEPRVVERLRREAETAQKVRHPNIVEFIGIERTPSGDPSVVMELLEGWNLAARLKAKGKVEPDLAIQMGVEICDALAASHGAGIVHRDVKPDNIFLTETEAGSSFKLLDFGAAHVADAKTLTVEGSLIGTPAYMSPEQAMGSAVTERTDVYSMGLVLYEALTGKNPFAGGLNIEETIVRIVSLTPEPPMKGAEASEEHRALDEIVQKALEKRPEDRWASATELRDALKEIQGGNAKKLKVARPKGAASAPKGAASGRKRSELLRVFTVAAPIVVVAIVGYALLAFGAAKIRVDVRPADLSPCSVESTRAASIAMMSALERVPDVVPVIENATFVLAAKCRTDGGATTLITSLREEKTNKDRESVIAKGTDPRAVAARVVVELSKSMKWSPKATLAQEAAGTEVIGGK